ncbi:hypothetical protein B7494_g1300 [Chlorociboria aeruginascens]|nr:hypothetical protein B7494_g1300 [Chlorociboria aeruginascens]
MLYDFRLPLDLHRSQDVSLSQSALDALGPVLRQICNITSTPGISVGVLHHGEIIHTANYGFRDVEKQLPPNIDTSWLVCLMTKAITASIVGMMVDEGKLDFTTQLQDVFPETGLAPYDGLWFSSDNRIVIERSQAIPIFSYVPAARPLRTDFVYNNIAYEIIGQVLEKVSGSTYLQLLHERIIKPLKLNRTFFAEEPFDGNTAKSYAALSNGSAYELSPWGHGKDLLIGAASAMRSSISDLLVLYKSFMDAANSEVAHTTVYDEYNPFKLAPQLLGGKIGIPSKSLREYSYAAGWMRAQLPNVVDLFADYEPPVLGKGSASRLMVHHQETVFDNDFDPAEYLAIARTAGERNIQFMADVHEQLLEGRTTSTPAHSLSAYAGRYHNAIGNYFIDIRLMDDRLQVAYMGAEHDTFDLQTYQTDRFFWWLDFDESVMRARLPGWPKEYFTLKFGCPTSPSWWDFGQKVKMQCLTWKHEFWLPGDGEVFQEKGCNPSSAHGYQRVVEDLK